MSTFAFVTFTHARALSAQGEHVGLQNVLLPSYVVERRHG